MPTLMLSGATLTVRPHEFISLGSQFTENYITDDITNDIIEEPQCATATAAPSFRMLRIHGFKPNMSKNTVEMFIENQSRETELESCDYDAKTGVAVVAFKNAQGNIL